MSVAAVTLRPAEPEDAQRLFAWRGEASVRRYQPLTPLTASQLRSEISTRRHQDLYGERGSRFDWIVLYDGQPVGWITLVVHSWEHGLGECGYAVSTPYQGRGIMSKALALLLEDLFENTVLHRIEARCALDNRASHRVLDKLGFRLEGTLRGYFRLHGERIDNLLFARLRGD